ncbi:GlsB/YeaQ/YmgE family stress response membrane protein [Thermorudis peleae]|uniref:GlsB/YeaQ/YmgE family stress response membrane protein n=1 Tax=Thermorudis peleae TaxID=1382356 RepID=UPI003BB15E92
MTLSMFVVGSLFGWLLVGLLAGWLAGLMTRGRGFGCLGNIAIGLVGAIIGGYLFSRLGFHGPVGFFGSVLIAAIGAALLLVVLSVLRGTS